MYIKDICAGIMEWHFGEVLWFGGILTAQLPKFVVGLENGKEN